MMSADAHYDRFENYERPREPARHMIGTHIIILDRFFDVRQVNVLSEVIYNKNTG